MAQFEVNILGCGSATPSLRHLPACQVIDLRDHLMMIDCGEGAQLSMRRQSLKFSRLGDIFISHLHGDHCLGLTGLLSTLALQDKAGEVNVYTFADGVKILSEAIDFFCRERPYRLNFNVITPDSGIICDNRSHTVEAFPLYHRIECAGFIIREKPKLRHLCREMVDFLDIPVRQLAAIKAGEDYVRPDGTVIPNSRLTTPAEPSFSYAYCSDTRYDERVARAVEGVDVIYHEATYTDAAAAKAHARGHATASEAARIARDAGARLLVLGHFSKTYNDESEHLAEARAIFPDTIAANEGMRIDLYKSFI